MAKLEGFGMHEMWLACDVHSLAHVVQTLFSTPEASTDVLCMRHTHSLTHSYSI